MIEPRFGKLNFVNMSEWRRNSNNPVTLAVNLKRYRN